MNNQSYTYLHTDTGGTFNAENSTKCLDSYALLGNRCCYIGFWTNVVS